jgi:transcriptional regulator with XRE-family HTH domain
MSRRQIAKESGISDSTLAAAFARRSQMTYANIAKIAKVLQVSPCDLDPDFDVIAELHNHAEGARTELDTLARHFYMVKLKTDEFKIMNILEDLKSPLQNIDLLYDILAGVYELNEEAQRKVLDYIWDLNSVCSYRSEVAQMTSAALSRTETFAIDNIINKLPPNAVTDRILNMFALKTAAEAYKPDEQ